MQLLKGEIIKYFRTYRADELNKKCQAYGIICDPALDPINSKRTYLKSGLDNKNFADLKNIAKQIIKHDYSLDFVKSTERFLDDDFFQIPILTRRLLLNFCKGQKDISGKVSISELIGRTWDINEEYNFDFEIITLRQFVVTHAEKFHDMTCAEILENVLDFIYISDDKLKRFLETIVDPSVRSKEDQLYYVTSINKIISSNEVKLSSCKQVGGLDVYKLERCTTGISGKVRNIIFAAIGCKADIVIDDALSNNLKVVDPEHKCLYYDFPIEEAGLSWQQLVTWWNKNNPDYTLETEKVFVNRLCQSCDSEPEKRFLRTYYNYIYCLQKNGSQKAFPALLPQVQCHYDPKSAKMRGGKLYVVQRMDFLMLMPHGVRVIIEIDGRQHYSETDGTASPSKYASMVKNDRDLKLYGYDVYRFGGYEFAGANSANDLKVFFQKLFQKYEI